MNSATVSRSVQVDSNPENQENSSKGKERKSGGSVPFYKLFSFADSTDVILMILGTVGAVGHGLCNPLMTILVGEMTDTFGKNMFSNSLVHEVSKVSRNIHRLRLHAVYYYCLIHTFGRILMFKFVARLGVAEICVSRNRSRCGSILP